MSYYTKITKVGLAAITAAINEKNKLPITYMAFGDGHGTTPEPDENAIALVNEVYRTSVNKVEVHNKNPNWLVCEAIIPSSVGGFNIREVALFDNTGTKMLAVANYPPTYKPTTHEGAAKIQTIRIVLQVDNSGNFELVIDPDIVLATVAHVNEKTKDLVFSIYDYAELDDVTAEHGRSVLIKKEGLVGEFVYKSDSLKIHDGGTVIKDEKNRIWERLYSGNILLSWFGDNHVAAIHTLESIYENKRIDLQGMELSVDAYPKNNIYINGQFINSSATNGAVMLSAVTELKAGHYGLVAGANNAPLILGNKDYRPEHRKNLIIIGNENLKETTRAYNTISIGSSNFKKTPIVGTHNIAIGTDIMWNLASTNEWYEQGQEAGTRNIGIGGNALTFLQTGYNNLAIGRNTSQCLVGGINTVAIGSNALGGEAPIGLTGEMENCAPSSAVNVTAIGAGSLQKYIGAGTGVAIGTNCMSNARLGSNFVAIGNQVAMHTDLSITGFKKISIWSGTQSATYTHSGNTLNLYMTNTRGAVVGGRVLLRLLDGDSKTFQNDKVVAVVTDVSNNVSITVAHPIIKNASGNAEIYATYGLADAVSNVTDFVAIGSNAAATCSDLRDATVVGLNVANNANLSTLNKATIIGSNAGRNALGLSGCVAVGRVAMFAPSIYTDSTAIGHGALSGLIDGSTPETLHHSTGIGYNAKVSGRDQVQVGGPGSTVYAYGAIQDRSDIRDKSDIESMPEVMTDFVLGLNPVQGRWDMRDDYIDELFPPIAIPEEPVYPDQPIEPIEENFIFENDGVYINRTDLFNAALDKYKSDYQAYESEKSRLKAEYDAAMAAYNQANDIRTTEVKAWWANPSRDGSKKRTRKHNWFIAQEVKSLSDQLGIDFAGLQDHKLIDGTDTLTIGYEEFIPPIVATLQKAWERLDAIDERLKALETL